ncbi:hypothetical protein ACFSBZ_05075 [Amnibacterium flavum]|uniref:Uncharacterized protein n=1 Tax=Amnibacterium flavum TaxID=2173173 RepID=A0A2V1HNL9_9MICO|nr:hypothetical protein [Amnibacterium flavum]PVZ94148.1 hypothetical protein DDQ50_10395 [Amnibacterium flavum]
MSPKVAGILVALAAVLAAIASGWLIATPPFSVPGAILLTVATIAFAYGVFLSLRRSWQDPPWPTPRAPNLRRTMIFQLVMAIPLLVLGPISIGLTVSTALESGWTGGLAVRVAGTVLFTLSGVSSAFRVRRLIRLADEANTRRETTADECAPTSTDAGPGGRGGAGAT